MFLTSSDFVGKYKLAKDSYSKKDIDAYIEKYEEYYLMDLLGCDLYEAFKADLNDDDSPKPQSNRFRKIFYYFCEEDSCGMMYRSEGILEMLKGYVYYHYLIDQKYKNTIVGTVVNETSFSREVPIAQSTIEDRYNIATDVYIAIQMYIMDHPEDYPEFKGIKKRKSFFGGAF